MNIRNIRDSDYGSVIDVIDDWWGGRHMADMLPRLFFQHFQDTCLVAEDDGEVVAFLIGFVSQSKPKEAYIHFVGVHPLHRGRHLGETLYDMFFRSVRDRGCTTVRCVTSPVNKGSIAFHTRMGFRMESGSTEMDGVPVQENYDGHGQGRVRFVRDVERADMRGDYREDHVASKRGRGEEDASFCQNT